MLRPPVRGAVEAGRRGWTSEAPVRYSHTPLRYAPLVAAGPRWRQERTCFHRSGDGGSGAAPRVLRRISQAPVRCIHPCVTNVEDV